MKRTLMVLICLLIRFIAIGQTNELLGTWQIDTSSCITINKYQTGNDFKEHASENILTIIFLNDSTFKAILSPNSCFGEYHIDKESIKINCGGCTKICCDSELSLMYYNKLKSVTRFEIINGDLVLSSEKERLYFKRKK